MLKGISPVISPELLKILDEMGHGDELVISDGNFPGASVGQRVVRLDGHGGAEIMSGIIELFPLDTFVEKPLAVMEVPDGMFPGNKAPIWKEFLAIAKKDLPGAEFEFMEHEAFIDRCRKAYCVVQSGESALYANIILRKGVVTGDTVKPAAKKTSQEKPAAVKKTAAAKKTAAEKKTAVKKTTAAKKTKKS